MRSTDFIEINKTLKETKKELNLHGEIKWTKVTSNYLEKYKTIMDTFFDFIKEDKIKIRIMFRQNAIVPNVSREQQNSGFHLLYYQFVKHAFGFSYLLNENNVYLRLFFDKLPDKKTKNELFLNHIYGLQSLKNFERARIKIRRQDIVQVNSHDHAILQCMDIVLGAMAFRLNDGHKERPPGKKQRGKKTIAKEKLYKHILSLIRSFYPNFNIGTTTAKYPRINIWEHPYRHWKFTPKDFTIDESRFK